MVVEPALACAGSYDRDAGLVCVLLSSPRNGARYPDPVSSLRSEGMGCASNLPLLRHGKGQPDPYQAPATCPGLAAAPVGRPVRWDVRCGQCPLQTMGSEQDGPGAALTAAHERSWCQQALAIISTDTGYLTTWRMWGSYRALQHPREPCHLHGSCRHSRWAWRAARFPVGRERREP